MSHIEFIGPPGAGKSTIYNHMVRDQNRLVGEKTVTSRALSGSSRAFGSATGLIPQPVGEIISKLWYDMWIERTYFNKFADNNPNYQLFWDELSEEIKYENLGLESALNSTAAIYEAGTSVLQDNEILCLDEGFSQRLVSILWRSERIEASMISRYYSVTPSPRLIVYIKAPVRTCIERQQNRGNVVASKDWAHDDLERTQQKLHNICEKIVRIADDNLEVLTIKNDLELKML